MSCGLGAAILIFLLLKHVTDTPVIESDPQTLSEIKLLEEEIKEGEKNLVRIRNTISDVSDESVTAKGLARKIEEDIQKLKSVLEVIAPDSDADIPGLKNQIAKLQQQKKAIESSIPSGNKAYETLKKSKLPSGLERLILLSGSLQICPLQVTSKY